MIDAAIADARRHDRKPVSPTACRSMHPAPARSASRCPSATTPPPSSPTISPPAEGSRTAVTGPAGTRTYAELAQDASRFAAGLLSLGAKRGERVLLFLDDTPAYPAALFGAIARRPGAGAHQHADPAGPAAVLSGRLRRPHRHLRRRLRRAASMRPPARAPSSTRSSSSTASRRPHLPSRRAAPPNGSARPAPAACRSPTPTATTWRSGCTRRAPPAGPRASCTCSTTWPTRTSPTRAICWR